MNMFEDFLWNKKICKKNSNEIENIYDIRDHILATDSLYMIKNIRDILNDCNHIDRFDQM
jgi:hypothetical protein